MSTVLAAVDFFIHPDSKVTGQMVENCGEKNVIRKRPEYLDAHAQAVRSLLLSSHGASLERPTEMGRLILLISVCLAEHERIQCAAAQPSLSREWQQHETDACSLHLAGPVDVIRRTLNVENLALDVV